jgi:hypothetical protein
MWKMPDGESVCSLVFNPSFSPNSKNDVAKKYGKTGEKATWSSSRFLKSINAEMIEGYQLKYIYILNDEVYNRLTVPILPFSEIDEMGAGMYKGEKVSLQDRQAREV